MNSFDRENLNFLLTASKEDMEEWYRYATDDDYAYAHDLLRQRYTELTLQELELLDDEANYNVEEANAVLKKFCL